MKNKETLSFIDLTPNEFRCAAGMSCPAVLQPAAGTDGQNEYIIIGEIVELSDPSLRERVGPNEIAIRISCRLVDGAVSRKKTD